MKVQELDIQFTNIAEKGFCVGKAETGLVVFCKQVVPGDTAHVKLFKKRKKHGFADLLELKEPSPHRVEPSCKHFGICGGCSWQNLNYAEQVNQKENTFLETIKRIGKQEDVPYKGHIAADQIYYYRNKLEFSFSPYRWLTKSEIATGEELDKNVLGFHYPESFYKIVPIDDCQLQSPITNKILNIVSKLSKAADISYYDIKNNTGVLRNIIIKKNKKDQFQFTLVFAGEWNDQLKTLLDGVLSACPEITSCYYILNNKKNDSIFDCDATLYSGDPHIIETLGSIQYYISPKSFFQTNSIQAEKMFDLVKSYIPDSKESIVFDLYCGAGSISLYLADRCKSVVGVEIIQEAIHDANKNAALNNINNVRFICSDIDKLDLNTLEKPDIIVVDPPRAGLTPKLVDWLMQIQCDRIIYVSCNVATFARDIDLMRELYKIEATTMLDLFPHTSHLESVSLLLKK